MQNGWHMEDFDHSFGHLIRAQFKAVDVDGYLLICRLGFACCSS